MITTTMLLLKNKQTYHCTITNSKTNGIYGFNLTCTKRDNVMDFLDENEENGGEYLGGWVENKFLGSILQICSIWGWI